MTGSLAPNPHPHPRPQLATPEPPSQPLAPPPAQVLSLGLAGLRLLMSAEIDCADERGAYVELKTSRLLDSERQVASFERHKLLKFWLQVPPPAAPWHHPLATASLHRRSLPPRPSAPTTAPLSARQSFLAGVPRIVVGLRDDAGVVRELRPLETMKIPRMVRGKQDMWDPSACLNFGKAVLEWLQQQVRQLPAGASALLRYVPAEGALLLLRQHGEGEAPAAKRAAPSEWP